MKHVITASEAPLKQVIPLERLRQDQHGQNVACMAVNGDEVGTPGTGFFYSYAHAEKRDFVEEGKYILGPVQKEWKKRVPGVPSPPELAPVVHCLDYTDPTFREPLNGEVVVGLYREDDGTAAAVLLWADTRADLFRDMALGRYVRPPKFYLRLKEQPQIDPATGYPIIQGAVCPF
jgi:hypothetical protein